MHNVFSKWSLIQTTVSGWSYFCSCWILVCSSWTAYGLEMSDAMLGVGSLPPARYCWEPEMARLEVLLPVSARLWPPPPPPPPPCPKSMLPGDLKGSSDSFRRFSRSWADTEAERGMSWLEDGGLEESEETEGRGVEEELGLRTCTEDGVVSEGEDVSLSKHNTWNYTKRTNVKTKDSFFSPPSCRSSSYPQSHLHLEGAARSGVLHGEALVQSHVLGLQQAAQRKR